MQWASWLTAGLCSQYVQHRGNLWPYVLWKNCFNPKLVILGIKWLILMGFFHRWRIVRQLGSEQNLILPVHHRISSASSAETGLRKILKFVWNLESTDKGKLTQILVLQVFVLTLQNSFQFNLFHSWDAGNFSQAEISIYVQGLSTLLLWQVPLKHLFTGCSPYFGN